MAASSKNGRGRRSDSENQSRKNDSSLSGLEAIIGESVFNNDMKLYGNLTGFFQSQTDRTISVTVTYDDGSTQNVSVYQARMLIESYRAIPDVDALEVGTRVIFTLNAMGEQPIGEIRARLPSGVYKIRYQDGVCFHDVNVYPEDITHYLNESI